MKTTDRGGEPRRNIWQARSVTFDHAEYIIIKTETMIRVPTNRPPTHPGEMLLEEFLNPMGIDESELAEVIHVPAQRIREIITEQQRVTPSIALRLAKYFGMSADFWMNLQLRWDLYQTQQAESEDLNNIRPHVAA